MINLKRVSEMLIHALIFTLVPLEPKLYNNFFNKTQKCKQSIHKDSRDWIVL